MAMKALRCTLVVPLCAALSLSGCAHNWQSGEAVTPMTFKLPELRVGRGVGNLKHLVVLPALYNAGWSESFSGVPCVTKAESIRNAMADQTAKHLASAKDYRIAVIADRVVDGAPAPGNKDFLTEYSRRLYEARDGRPSAEIADLARRIAVIYKADGIVLVRGDYTSEDPITVSLMLFGMAKPGLTVEAWIFEAGSGRVVWRGSTWAPGCHWDVEPAFTDLENAIPDVMVR
jgi:hypothetical protein